MKQSPTKRLISILLLTLTLISACGAIVASAESARVKCPTYNQCSNGYVNGCEGFSLFQALRGKGYCKEMTVKEFMKTMPRAKSNPNNGFVGDPTKGWNASVNKGKRTTIFPAPLAKWANKFANAENITGASYSKLRTELRNGNPIVIWVTYNWQKPSWRTYSWGKAVTNGHVVTLVGFDTEKNCWLINDPYYGKGEYWIKHSTMEKTWQSRRYAVVVRGEAYLNHTKYTLAEGEVAAKTLNLVNTGSEKFVSSNKNVVTVSNDKNAAVVTAHKAGTAVLSTTFKGKTYICTVTVVKPELNVSNIELYEGKTKKLNLLGVGGETFKSANTKVAKVAADGTITAVAAGKTTVSAVYNGKAYKCTVTVKAPVLNVSEVELYEGKTKKLNLLGVGGETFKSANTKVAKVAADGTITAVAAGKTTVSAVYNGKTYKCTVTVKALTLNFSEAEMTAGQTKKLNLIGTGDETFKSSDESVATVAFDGTITAVAAGKATITVSSNKKQYTCTITVIGSNDDLTGN